MGSPKTTKYRTTLYRSKTQPKGFHFQYVINIGIRAAAARNKSYNNKSQQQVAITIIGQ
jgi:hypothetical protein